MVNNFHAEEAFCEATEIWFYKKRMWGFMGKKKSNGGSFKENGNKTDTCRIRKRQFKFLGHIGKRAYKKAGGTKTLSNLCNK